MLLPTVNEIIEVNKKVLDRLEPHEVVNRNNLESLLAAFEYYETDNVFHIAGILLWKISKAHAFRQGNKRTAVVVTLTFLNSYEIEIERNTREDWDNDQLYELSLRIAKGEVKDVDSGSELTKALNKYV